MLTQCEKNVHKIWTLFSENEQLPDNKMGDSRRISGKLASEIHGLSELR